MQHAFLVSFLEERTTPEDFCLEIRNEVDACEAGFRSPTGVGYIVVTDGPLTLVTRGHMKRLLQSLLDERIPWISVNYTGDCLMMSDDFQPEDEVVAEAIAFVADDSRAPTPAEIREAVSALN